MRQVLISLVAIWIASISFVDSLQRNPVLGGVTSKSLSRENRISASAVYASAGITTDDEPTLDSLKQSDDAASGYWLPVISLASIGQDKTPRRVNLLNKDYVVWWSQEMDADTGKEFKRYSVMADECSHRMAPLSQGRVDPVTKCIECPYHAYQFSHSGACTRIPQAPPPSDRNVIFNPKASVQSLPTYQVGGILFAFFHSRIIYK